MASRDIWSKGGSRRVQDLLAGLFCELLIRPARKAPLYLCSPYLSDFVIFDNRYQQFSALFRERAEEADQSVIRFTSVLKALSVKMPVRVVTVRHSSSAAFVDRLSMNAGADVSVRLADAIYHEKGLLCEDFYIEGSMNFTFSGIYIRDEKISCHISADQLGRQKIDAAFLEFDRLWNRLSDSSRPQT